MQHTTTAHSSVYHKLTTDYIPDIKINQLTEKLFSFKVTLLNCQPLCNITIISVEAITPLTQPAAYRVGQITECHFSFLLLVIECIYLQNSTIFGIYKDILKTNFMITEM